MRQCNNFPLSNVNATQHMCASGKISLTIPQNDCSQHENGERVARLESNQERVSV